jgi:hypothetical protein
MREQVIERVRRAAAMYVEGAGEYTMKTCAQRYSVSAGAVAHAVKALRAARQQA